MSEACYSRSYRWTPRPDPTDASPFDRRSQRAAFSCRRSRVRSLASNGPVERSRRSDHAARRGAAADRKKVLGSHRMRAKRCDQPADQHPGRSTERRAGPRLGRHLSQSEGRHGRAANGDERPRQQCHRRRRSSAARRAERAGFSRSRQYGISHGVSVRGMGGRIKELFRFGEQISRDISYLLRRRGRWPRTHRTWKCSLRRTAASAVRRSERSGASCRSRQSSSPMAG